MKNILVFALYSIFCFDLSAQGTMSFQDGNPAKEYKYTDVGGSELLSSSWASGWVKGNKGALHKNLKLKYNVPEDKVYFLGKNDISMEFLTPPREFSISYKGDSLLFRNGFPPSGDFGQSSYYQVLVDGSITLLKKFTKSIVEEKAYGSATKMKKIVDDEFYFIFVNKKLTKVKSDKKFFLALLVDHKNEIDDYFSNNKINLKKESDLVKFIDHLND